MTCDVTVPVDVTLESFRSWVQTWGKRSQQ